MICSDVAISPLLRASSLALVIRHTDVTNESAAITKKKARVAPGLPQVIHPTSPVFSTPQRGRPTHGRVYFSHMAAKNPNKKRKATLDSVLSTVKRGFADLEGKMDRGFAAVAEDIVAIKDDIADVTSTLADHTKIPHARFRRHQE
jgi:hypothetical protein